MKKFGIIDSMKITIKLFASLKQYGPEEQETTVPENMTVADVIEMLKIPDKMPMLRIVNGEHVDKNYHLKEGDVLALFPPIAGGQHKRAQASPFCMTTERNRRLW